MSEQNGKTRFKGVVLSAVGKETPSDQLQSTSRDPFLNPDVRLYAFERFVPIACT
jgi:hypothetical protein